MCLEQTSTHYLVQRFDTRIGTPKKHCMYEMSWHMCKQGCPQAVAAVDNVVIAVAVVL